MGQVIGELLPLALGVAISPIPIIAVILMLLAPRAGGTSAAFLLGWVAGIVVATAVFVVLASLTGLQAGESSSISSWIKLALGAVLLLLAVRQWRGRPREDQEPAMPGWMAAIDTFTPIKAGGLGFLLSAVNPKNLAMAVAAGVAIGGGGLSTGATVVAIVVFTVLAASTVAAPVIAYAVASTRLASPLDALRRWLVQNNATVMSLLLLVIGVVLVGKGIAGVA